MNYIPHTPPVIEILKMNYKPPIRKEQQKYSYKDTPLHRVVQGHTRTRNAEVVIVLV